MQVQFHGAAGEVTGSCHLVEVGSHRVLLDCGMIQGSAADERRNLLPFDFDAAAIDAVVLSHAHIDHSGRLPLLLKRGFRGPIFTHAATIDLAGILLADSAAIAAQDAERDNRHLSSGATPSLPLYDAADVAATMQRMRPLAYRAPHEILPGVQVTLRDAGHILHANRTVRALSGVIQNTGPQTMATITNDLWREKGVTRNNNGNNADSSSPPRRPLFKSSRPDLLPAS